MGGGDATVAGGDGNEAAKLQRLRSATGAHLKRPTVGKSKSFMSVPDHMHGFHDVHEQDEREMEASFASRKATPLRLAEQVAGKKLEGPWVPCAEDILGTYTTRSGGCCGPSYCVKSFRFDAEDIVPAHEIKSHLTSCCGAAAHALGEGSVVMHMLIKKDKAEFQNSCLAYIVKSLCGDVVYVCTMSENGIVRFHLPPELGTGSRLCFAYADSESVCGFFKNINHAMTHGCFCLGMYYKEIGPPDQETEEEADDDAAAGRQAPLASTPGLPATTTLGTRSKPVLVRFNRWAEDLVPYWAAGPGILPKGGFTFCWFNCCSDRTKDEDG